MVDHDRYPRQYLHLPAAICKNSRGRVIPLNEVAQVCVVKLLTFYQQIGFSIAPDRALFQNRLGGHLSVRSVQKLIAMYRNKRARRSNGHSWSMFKMKAAAIEEGKPENIAEKIATGKVDKYFQAQCLMEQPYIKDDSKTIESLIKETIAKTGENIRIKRFARFDLGKVRRGPRWPGDARR